MRALRGLGLLAATFGLAGLLAGPAGAARRRLPRSEPLQAVGSIVYSWHGDPARGCAATSLCPVTGTLVISHFQSPVLAGGNLNLVARATVRATDGSGECVDTLAGPVVLLLRRAPDGSFRAGYPSGSLTGRCAEPLSQELAALSLPVRLTGPRRRPTLNLRYSRSFAAGPFAGGLRSTLVLRPTSASRSGAFSGSSSSSGSGTSRSAKTKPVRAEFVNLVLEVRVLPSALDFTFGGEGDPFCQILESCGSGGSLALSASGTGLRLSLQAVRRVRTRVSARRAIDDFRHGRLPFSFPGLVNVQSQTRESLRRGDGTTCQDASGGQLQLVVGSFLPNRHAHAGSDVPVMLTSANEPSDILRTHCPGPLDADVLASSSPSVYASGAVAAAALLRPQVEVPVGAPGSFSGLGYTGTRSGTVDFELTRVSLHAGTEGAR